MARTNIEIDAALIERVMARYRIRTKREAVDRALRALDNGVVPMTTEEVLAMKGTGWGEDGLELSDLRDHEPIEEL
ncbi:MAG: type II toxin-antitoxin system VapB family antitoxin [Actinomycetota bacterium]|nr:type II toxin-antitoxin system VapB family antitoxin [Actinomycetota bacterium]